MQTRTEQKHKHNECTTTAAAAAAVCGRTRDSGRINFAGHRGVQAPEQQQQKTRSRVRKRAAEASGWREKWVRGALWVCAPAPAESLLLFALYLCSHAHARVDERTRGT